MGERKFTAGPWVVFGGCSPGDYSVLPAMRDGAICERASEADAQLIAAAPDLYEALDKAPYPSTQGGWREFIPRYYAWLKLRDAALANARGEATP